MAPYPVAWRPPRAWAPRGSCSACGYRDAGVLVDGSCQVCRQARWAIANLRDLNLNEEEQEFVLLLLARTLELFATDPPWRAGALR